MQCRQLQFVFALGEHLVGYVQHDLSISGSSEGQQYLEYPLQWHSLFLLHQLVMRPVTEFDE